jgi:hypothetical protein
VLAVYVRRATPEPGAPERFLGQRLFAEPAEVTGDAAHRGLADAGCLEAAFPGAFRAPAPAKPVGPAPATMPEPAPCHAPEPLPER